MRDLIHNILSENYVAAEDSFQSHMNEIMENKLYEVKKMVQEQHFPTGIAGVEARKKAGFKRASDVLGDPTAGRKKGAGKNVPAKDDIGTHLQRLGAEWKKAKFGERRQAVRMIHQAVKGFQKKQPEPEAPKPAAAPEPAAKKPATAQRGFTAPLSGTPKKKPHDELTRQVVRRMDLNARAKEFAKRRPDVMARVVAAKAKKGLKSGLKTGLKGAIDSLPSVYEE